jgi:hypothetical protein
MKQVVGEKFLKGFEMLRLLTVYPLERIKFTPQIPSWYVVTKTVSTVPGCLRGRSLESWVYLGSQGHNSSSGSVASLGEVNSSIAFVTRASRLREVINR